MPVDQQVERDHRRDEQQGHEIHQRQPAAPHRGHDGRGHRGPVLRQIDERPVERRLERRKARAEPVPAEALHEALEALGLARQRRHHLPHLVDEHRHEQDQRKGQQHGDDADDQDCRPRPVQAVGLEAVGHGVEEVGADDGGDEGEQDVPEQGDGEDEDDERRDPEP